MAGNVVQILIQGKDQFSPKAQKAQRSAKGLKGGMSSLGKTVVGVGAGFIAAQASIAGVSKLFSSTIGAAVKFEAQLAQIRALTGATKKDTDFLSGAIKDLAKEVGKSPAELGAGAYFILSSGIEDAADAAQVLEVAAKASTIGLGETERVADALTTVLNAYGLEASDAAHVTDVMIEAVKQGKAEASAFAGVLGRVVPLAAQMGISFEEVAANLATFTRLGVSADEAATGLRGVMNSLINPTDQTRATMEELGLSVEGLRKQIKEKGLLAALDSMMSATGGNEEALSKLFPNIRALTSVLGTAGVQMDSYKNILNATNDATGNLEEGFGIVSDTTQQKLKVAMAELNITLMELGEDVLPVVVPIAKAFALVIADIAAAAGIALNPVEALSTGIEGLNKPMLGLLNSTEVTSKTIVGLGRDAKMSNDEIADWGKQIGLTSEEISQAFREVDGAANQFVPTAVDVTDQLGDIANAAPVAASAVFELASETDNLKSSLAALSGAQKESLATLSDLASTRTQEQVALDQQINSLRLEENAARMAEIGQSNLGGATESTTDAISRQVGALQNLAASAVPQALNDEIIALEREMKVLQLGKIQIEAQINARNRLAQAQLAMAKVANLPALAAQKKLELDRAKILETVGGETDNLTDAQKEAVKAIDDEIQALQSGINVRTLEAELTNLQARASDTNREAMQGELNKIIDQIGATGDLKKKRELYIDTLMPIELLQEIDALERQKTKLGNMETGARDAGGAIQTMSSKIGDQIGTLQLQREKIDLVTEGWRLQGEAMLGLPTTKDVLQGFKEAMILMMRAAMLGAIASGDIGLQRQIADQVNQLAAFTPLQHGTPSFGGGMALLGERGPELAMLPTGTRVLNAGQTAQAVGGGGGLTINISGVFAGDERTAMELAHMIAPEIRRMMN